MARGPAAAVGDLVDLARVGEFSLPAKLTDSHNAYLAIQQLNIGTVEVFNVNTAADRINELARQGEPIDLAELGRSIETGSREYAGAQAALQAQRMALDRAGDELSTVAYGLAEEIITECLRPVFESILEEARGPAEIVRQHPVTAQDLRMRDSTEIRKVRSALRTLEPLALRRSAIAQARGRANQLGQRRPERDADNMFADLETPQVLVPSWTPGARFAYPDIPTDPIERLVWLTGEGVPGRPWLATVADQDRAWHDVYGEELARRQARNASWPRVVAG